MKVEAKIKFFQKEIAVGMPSDAYIDGLIAGLKLTDERVEAFVAEWHKAGMPLPTPEWQAEHERLLKDRDDFWHDLDVAYHKLGWKRYPL